MNRRVYVVRWALPVGRMSQMCYIMSEQTDRHDIAEILLKVALITKNSKFQTNQVQILFFFFFFLD
jgi:hypothetical protein